MEQIIKYIAFDGKEFEDEDKCVDYEWKHNIKDILPKHLQIYNQETEEITDVHFPDVDKVYTVNIKTLDGLKFFHQWSDDCGVESPFSKADFEDETKLGVWAWEPFHWTGGWCHLTKMKNSIDKLIEKLK